MQISAANLLLAGQQANAPARGDKAAFEAALMAKKPEASKDEGFETLLFRSSASAANSPAAATSGGPAQPYAAPKPPGSQIDIRI